MDGIKVSVHHATHYEMSSSEDDYSDLSSDDLVEVEDVMEDATIGYPELATASGRRQFIHRLTCGGLQGSDNNLEEASGSDYFVKEIGFNFDNSEQSLFLDTAARNEFSVHLNGVGEQVLLCDESDRTETPSSSVTSPSVGAAVPNGELRAHLQGSLQISNPNSDGALRGSEQLLLLSTPQEKPVIMNALQTTENLPKFKVVRMEQPETPPVVEPLHGTGLDVKACYDIFSEVESLLDPSPSHSEFSPPSAPGIASPGVILASRNVSDSTNTPQDPSSSSSSTAKSSICDDSLMDALQRNIAKKAAPEDSYETTSTDLSRESSLSSTCRLSLASRGQALEGDDNEKKEVKVVTSGKGKGKKKKKVAQTRRAHNCRAFKKTADPPSSERESSSDELEDQEWISNRPITRHFFNNLDKFCNRASRPRKSKPRGRPRKNAGSSKPVSSQPQPVPAVVQSLPPPSLPANPALNEHLLAAPVALDVQGDAATLAADANAVFEPYTDELFEEEELMRMFPSHLTQVIEEAGLNISDLTFNTSAVFDEIRCDESIMDPLDGNLVPFSDATATVAAAASVAAAVTAQRVSACPSTAPVAVELQLPAIPCEKPIEVIKFTDDTSTSPAQVEVLLADESQLPLKLGSLGSINSDPVIVSEPMMKDSDIALETKAHFPLKPELSPVQDEAVSPSPPLPNIRPGSVVLAYMDASGNLVPVSSTGITMEEVQSAVAGELESSYKTNPSLKSASEPTTPEAAACDVKPDVAALEVRSSAEDVECNVFDGYEMKQNKEKVPVTPAPPAVLTNKISEEDVNVKVEPLNFNVKEEVTGHSSCSDASDSTVDECKVKLPSSMSPSNVTSDIAQLPKKNVPVIKDENNASLPTRNETDRPMDRLATTHPVNDKALLSPPTEGVICKIPDYLQTIFKEQKCEDNLPERGSVDSEVTLAVKASSEVDNSEIGASDVQEKSCSTGTSSDCSDHSGSQKPRKKINVTEYFKRKHRVADAAKESTRSASVNQAKQDASASSKSISKALPQVAKTRPEITNIKSMLSDDVPEYVNAVVPQEGTENKVIASGIAKSAPTGAVNSKSKNVKVTTSKCVSGTKPKIVTDVSQNLLQPQAKAQNQPRQSKDIRTNDAQVNHSKAPESENVKVTNPATVIENSDKLPAASRQISVPTEAERKAVTRVAKKVLSSFDAAPAQTSRGKVESERCTSPCSRSSSIGSLRGRKRDRSSSVVSSSYTSDSIDSRKSRRRRRHRSTSPSVSPIPLFHKKRNKKSHKRHKSHRKRRRQSSSSSSRSRSPSHSRRRRRGSFSPARSRSRSLSSDSYSRKKRSGKRSRYNSRSRSRSFSPNTVYSVGCACGGGDPKFVGHLPSCQHYSPDARYPTPDPPLRPPQQYYHPPQYPYQHGAQYPYHPYYYDFNAGPPQEYGGAYLHGRRSETDAFVYSRSARSSSVTEPNLRAKQVEERLVVYVGRIREGTTKDGLRDRFKKFGTITDISLHFRDRGDNYGFVTFTNSEEANRAIENGNKGEELQFDLCFGGRRQFCRQQYKDLDALPASGSLNQPSTDFDSLLREMLYRR